MYNHNPAGTTFHPTCDTIENPLTPHGNPSVAGFFGRPGAQDVMLWCYNVKASWALMTVSVSVKLLVTLGWCAVVVESVTEQGESLAAHVGSSKVPGHS